MKCRQCGTEIADRALICYRCGTATTEPRVKPPAAARGRARARWPAMLALAALVLAGLLMGLSGSGDIAPEVRWAVVALAVLAAVAWWFTRRRPD